jgi:hypothetical protein
MNFEAKQRTKHIDTPCDGSEKTKAFLVERGQPRSERYK